MNDRNITISNKLQAVASSKRTKQTKLDTYFNTCYTYSIFRHFFLPNNSKIY